MSETSNDRPTDKSSVILFFIDGLGIGPRGDNNPLDRIPALEPIANFSDCQSTSPSGGILVHTDPRLGVAGRPQSASGQTTILTGKNAPKVLGYHKQGFPNRELRDILQEFSIFRQLKARGIVPNIFANAYRPAYFEREPRWKSATTCAVEAAGMQFRRLPDLLGRTALFHDFTNQTLIESGVDIPVFSPEAAADILVSFTSTYRFVLYEYFITDKIGHKQDIEAARLHLPMLAEFVRHVAAKIDAETTTLILTSDHGNIEDLSVRNHTLNDVPTILWGRRRETAAGRISDLTHITPVIIDLLGS